MVGEVGGLAFVGRRDELARLRENLAAACSGQARIVCVEGLPGVGKTALLRAFLDEAGDSILLQASGDEDEAGLAWGVLQQLVRTPLRRSVPELASLSSAEQLSGGFLTAGAALLNTLAALQDMAPVILVVDDVHWCDAPSTATLRFAARRLSAERILVLVTSRPDPGGRAQGWIRLSEERGLRIRLDGLRLEDLSTLAIATVGAPLTPRAARRLLQHTEGHPMYARAVLEELGVGPLESTTGVLGAPRSFTKLILARVADCSAPAAALLAAAAVLGRRSPLAHVLGLAPTDDPTSALSEVVVAGLVTELGTGPTREVSFPHPLIHAAVYSGLSPAQRADLHRAAAGLTDGEVALEHRLAASIGPDDVLAAELEANAMEVLAKGDLQRAAVQLEQAAGASERPEDRHRLLLAACETALDVGDLSMVAAKLDELEQLEGARRDVVVARVAHLRDRLGEARSLMDRSWRALAESSESAEAGTRSRSGGARLTRGETAVVELVVSGLSNAEVAERLVVSRKAVEYHLSNVYAKLGISSRTQLLVHVGTVGR